MPENRIAYNVQEIFFGPPNGGGSSETSLLPGYQILKRINGIQSISYDFNATRVDVGSLGKSRSAIKQVIEPPTINIDFSYVLNGASNERKMGFSVSQGENSDVPPLFENYFNENRGSDSRNIYLITNQSGQDVRESRTDISDSLNGLGAGIVSSIESPSARSFGVLSFQNAYLSSYSVDVSIGSLPNAKVSFIADNAVFFSSGTNIPVPLLDSKLGVVTTGTEKILIPKYFDPSTVGVLGNIEAFKPGNITVAVQKAASTTDISFESDHIQSFGMDISLEREKISYLGHKLYVDRPVVLPAKTSINLGLLVYKNLSGSFLSNINKDDIYDLTVTCKEDSGAVGLQYKVLGAKFDSASYSSSIGENKMVDLKFSVDLNFEDKTSSVFISGQSKAFTDFIVGDHEGKEEPLTDDNGELLYYEYLLPF